MNRPYVVLNLAMGPNDADAVTIQDYLLVLLHDVIEYEEGFDGKRPFGNSGWISELEMPLLKAGLISGSLDEDGCIESVDDNEAKKVIFEAINSLRRTT